MSEQTKKSPNKIVRIALRPQTKKILEDWRVQLQQIFPTFDPSLSDLNSWGVERSPVLSKMEIQDIKRRFFDEVRELEGILLRLKKARLEGDEDAVLELLSLTKFRRKPIKAKAIQVLET